MRVRVPLSARFAQQDVPPQAAQPRASLRAPLVGVVGARRRRGPTGGGVLPAGARRATRRASGESAFCILYFDFRVRLPQPSTCCARTLLFRP